MKKTIKKRRQFKNQLMKSKFMKTCPVGGGICLNPICAFGCIER